MNDKSGMSRKAAVAGATLTALGAMAGKVEGWPGLVAMGIVALFGAVAVVSQAVLDWQRNGGQS